MVMSHNTMSLFRIMSSKRFLYVSAIVIPAFLGGSSHAATIGMDDKDETTGVTVTHGYSETATAVATPAVSSTTSTATPTVPTATPTTYHHFNYKTLRFRALSGEEIAPPFDINDDRSQTTVDIYRHLRNNISPRMSFDIFDRDGTLFWPERLFCAKEWNPVLFGHSGGYVSTPIASAPNLIDWLEENWHGFPMEDEEGDIADFLDVQVILQKTDLRELTGASTLSTSAPLNGCSVRKLLDLGFPLDEIFQSKSIRRENTIEQGITAKDLKQAGQRVTHKMKIAGYSALDLLDGGYTLREIFWSDYDGSSGHKYSLEELRRKEKELGARRFTPEQVLAAGYPHRSVAKWFADAPRTLKALGIKESPFCEGFAPDEIEDLQNSWREDPTLTQGSCLDLRLRGHSWSAILREGRRLFDENNKPRSPPTGHGLLIPLC